MFPTVSIITPSYNQADYLEETILSVIGQNYPRLEHIVIDGGSTDRSPDILKSYESFYNLFWNSERDNGQSAAINKGLRMAHGDIIGWLNSDDTYMPDAISKAISHLLNNSDCGWVYGDGYWINETGKILGIYKSKPFNLRDLIVKGQYMVQPSVFFRRDLLYSVGYIDENLHYALDTDFFIRLGLVSRATYLPSVIATRRIHQKAKTSGNSLNFSYEHLLALEKLFKMPGLTPEIAALKKSAFSNTYFAAGSRFLIISNYAKSREYFLKSLFSDPNVCSIEKIKALICIFEAIMGVNWYIPGQRRLFDIQKDSLNGLNYVRWVNKEGKPTFDIQ
ncbi:glycosyltransferase [Candidatus Gottesmanbacteria bacterium]|nr:glycosyltransferase [Candidatus Gottesmanbacteria bacterium]MBM3712102.1 glycosyltransferase [Actinomycetota bacterium]